jgi:hypothetical protein
VSEKYCPAGEIECGRYMPQRLGSAICETGPVSWHEINDNWELCPWPSRQVRVEPVKFKPISNETAEAVCASMQRAYNDGFAAGRAYQSKKDKEAVEKYDDEINPSPAFENNMTVDGLQDALDEAAKGE